MKRYVIEKEFEYKGYPCAVVLQALGHRCGYVNVTGTRFKGLDYNDIPISVHGGLTYGTWGGVMAKSDNEYWIGWDYAHLGDGRDWEALEEKFYNDAEAKKDIEIYKRIVGEHDYGRVYTLEEVEDDCKDVVEQIIRSEGSAE